MPTLDWLNRADAFTTAVRVPYRLLEPVSSNGRAVFGWLTQTRDGLSTAAQLDQALA